ncbi:hypothetical protein SAE02_71750 [Skermanella aerolata]|uniref:Uncharacterized protein n=1 Tax=Skermanella aerolata TaxID=393310 RepID=A0A512E2U6_9PROT|nr:restriction endonuclease [Skermanella aerolata]GEO43027.1 hypothetical protein SAE02_71750 [Skermanella aerolata]
MAPPGPHKAAELVHTVLNIDSAPRPTRDVLIDIIIASRWHDKSVVEDMADAWLERFIKRLQYVIRQSRESGSYRCFSFNSSGMDYVQGYCYCEPKDLPEVSAEKILRSNTTHIYASFRLLRHDQFEILSGKVLELLKVERPFVSRRSADQGIDFFGKVRIGDMIKPSLLDPGAEKHFFVWLVGQAKHYQNTKVSTSEIRELVGSVELARAKVFAGNVDPLSDLEMRVCDPIIYLIFTTGKLTSDSQELLSRSGVLSFDGMQIAQFLADHGVALQDKKFDEQLFVNWVNS